MHTSTHGGATSISRKVQRTHKSTDGGMKTVVCVCTRTYTHTRIILSLRKESLTCYNMGEP